MLESQFLQLMSDAIANKSLINTHITQPYGFVQNFTYKWDRSNSLSVAEVERIAYQSTVQLMFRWEFCNFILVNVLFTNSFSFVLWCLCHCHLFTLLLFKTMNHKRRYFECLCDHKMEVKWSIDLWTISIL